MIRATATILGTITFIGYYLIVIAAGNLKRALHFYEYAAK